MAAEKQTYEFTEDRWFMNTFYKKGDRANFYAKQVEHEAHSIVAVKPLEPAPAPKAPVKSAPVK